MEANHFSRREVLAASLALGATIALNPFVSAFSRAEAKAPQILRMGQAGAEFDSGLRKAIGAVSQIQEYHFNDLNKLESHIGQHSGAVIVGIMNDGDFINFNEGLRARSADLICSGTHVRSKNFSRHYFQSTSRSLGIGSAFAQVVSQCGESALISESSSHEVSPYNALSSVPRPKLAQTPFTSWEQGLGFQLSMIASGAWSPSEPKPAILVGQNSASTMTYSSFVSFIAKL